MQHNLNDEVADKYVIFGIILTRMLDSVKSKKEAKKIHTIILGHLPALFNLFCLLINV